MKKNSNKERRNAGKRFNRAIQIPAPPFKVGQRICDDRGAIAFVTHLELGLFDYEFETPQPFHPLVGKFVGGRVLELGFQFWKAA